MSAVGDFLGDAFGTAQVRAAESGGATLSEAALGAGDIREAGIREGLSAQEGLGREGISFLQNQLSPFAGAFGASDIAGLHGLATDPNQQVDFLQGNPLFNSLRGQAREDTFRTQGRSGTLGGSGTDEILQNKFLSIGNDLINQQINRQLPLLNAAQGAAGTIGTGGANILQSLGQSQLLGNQAIGDVQGIALEDSAQSIVTGEVGAANARSQRAGNILGQGAQIAAMFSDERLKTNIEKIGSKNGINVYSWEWNDLASGVGLTGKGVGHIAQQIQEVHPELVTEHPNGFLMINYSTDKTVSLN